MLSLTLAMQLQKAGLRWDPQLHDRFIIPERGMDDRLFVITDVMAYIEVLRGYPMVTFHGTAEWALDYVLQSEAIWIPSETQLRDAIVRRATDLSLSQTDQGYVCSATYQGETVSFCQDGACEAYGSVLLQLLLQQATNSDLN